MELFMRERIVWFIFIVGFIACLSLLPAHESNATPMSPKFEKAVQIVLQHEGGLTNDKDDAGGTTKYGISLRYIKQTHLDINGDGVIDANDIIHLTQSEADMIYLHRWWLVYHYDEINDVNVATKLFDASVNMGASRAHKLVKMSLNHLYKKQIKVNANLDEATVKLINGIEPCLMLDEMRMEEEEFYKEIVARNPSQRKFLSGWLKRASW